MSNLTNGLDTILGENAVNISGGQKQRIAIARALYSDPEILVFDEATSSLDSETEREIMSVIRKLSVSKTIFFCSHKKSILNDCTQIYSFQNLNKILKRKIIFSKLRENYMSRIKIIAEIGWNFLGDIDLAKK